MMPRKYLSLWVPVLLWCALIFVLSGIPNLKTTFGFWDLVLRKAAHITEYALLFVLLRRAVAGTFVRLNPLSVYSASILFSIIYACSDEYHQSFVATRGPSFSDVLIDSAGVLLAFALYLYWNGRSKRNTG